MTFSLRNNLRESLGINEDQLNRLIVRAPYSYKVYNIPKRNGGERIIAQPARETKFIQHWLIQNVFQSLPIHECASAYRVGSSIKKNAAVHRRNSYISKFDFKDFFVSIKSDDLVRHFLKYLGNSFRIEDIKDIARISCIKFKNQNNLCLSIGAPSSPVLSNTIMHDFDFKIFSWCAGNGITYTRYADDLTFSTEYKGISSKIQSMIMEVIQDVDYPKLSLNSNKTIHVSKKYQRRITGIIINNEGDLSLGRAKKREISSLIHKFSVGELTNHEIYRLQGLLGYAKDVEPLFVSRMRAKYKSNLIDDVFLMRK